MLIMARDLLLAAFAQFSAAIVARPGRIDPGLKALIMYAVSTSAGCQYCVARASTLTHLQKLFRFRSRLMGSNCDCSRLTGYSDNSPSDL